MNATDFSKIACCCNQLFSGYEKEIPTNLSVAASIGMVAAITSLGLAIMTNKSEETTPLNQDGSSLRFRRLAVTGAHTTIFAILFCAAVTSFGLSFQYSTKCPNEFLAKLNACKA